MPLKLNVGLSKKIGQPDYGSLGASVNLELELDAAAVNDPDRLRQQIRNLFDRAKTSIDEELGTHRPAGQQGNGGHQYDAHGNGNGNSPPSGSQANSQTGNGSLSNGRAATASQIRALRAITTRQGLNLDQLLASRYRLHRIEDLSLTDASTLIDELKRPAPANGGGR